MAAAAAPPAEGAAGADGSRGEPAAGGVIPTLEEVELAHIRRVLAICGGNRTVAAQHLGITRQTLTKRLGSSAEEE